MLRKYLFLKIFLILTVLPYANMYCYFVKVLSFKTTDTPEYRFSMELYKNDTLTSLTHVMKEIAVPMWNILLVEQKPRTKNVNVLYNSTLKVCDFWDYMKRLKGFTAVVDNLFKDEGKSNMSLECPLRVGIYYMRDIMIPPDTGILRLMYVPKTTYTLYGNIYSQLPNKKMILKSSYEINGTVLKKC